MDSLMCNCTSNLAAFAAPRNDDGEVTNHPGLIHESKHSARHVGQISGLNPRVSPDKRGGSRSSRTCGEMRWTRWRANDERRRRVRRSRVVLTPRCWRQVPGKLTLLAGDGGNKAGHRG